MVIASVLNRSFTAGPFPTGRPRLDESLNELRRVIAVTYRGFIKPTEIMIIDDCGYLLFPPPDALPPPDLPL